MLSWRCTENIAEKTLPKNFADDDSDDDKM